MPTWMYSIGLSSPASRFVVTRDAGKAFGAKISNVRRREFVTVRELKKTEDQRY